MKRYIRSSEQPVRTFQNIRNENKYIEVKKSADGHTWARQYMKWDTENGEVKNYSGSVTNRGRYHRYTQDSLNKILEDYVEV